MFSKILVSFFTTGLLLQSSSLFACDMSSAEINVIEKTNGQNLSSGAPAGNRLLISQVLNFADAGCAFSDFSSSLAYEFYMDQYQVGYVSVTPWTQQLGYSGEINTRDLSAGRHQMKGVIYPATGGPVEFYFEVFVYNGPDLTPPLIEEFIWNEDQGFENYYNFFFRGSDNDLIKTARLFLDGNLYSQQNFNSSPNFLSPGAEWGPLWVDIAGLNEGIHSLRLELDDRAGNTSQKELSFRIGTSPDPGDCGIDQAPLKLTQAPTGEPITGSAYDRIEIEWDLLNYDCSISDLAYVRYYMDGKFFYETHVAQFEIATLINTRFLTNGLHSLEAIGVLKNGYESQIFRDFNVENSADLLPPKIETLTLIGHNKTQKFSAFHIEATDNDLPSRIQVIIDRRLVGDFNINENANLSTPFNYSTNLEISFSESGGKGRHKLTLKVYDRAGNVTSRSLAYKVPRY